MKSNFGSFLRRAQLGTKMVVGFVQQLGQAPPEECFLMSRFARRLLVNSGTKATVLKCLDSLDDTTLQDIMALRADPRMKKAIAPIETYAHYALMARLAKEKFEARRIMRHDLNPPLVDYMIKGEKVHRFEGLAGLLRRVEGNRMIYGLFHPFTKDLPIVMISVALTDGLPSSIREILETARQVPTSYEPIYAIFYSISICNAGLRGMRMGNLLIKQVLEDAPKRYPTLTNMQTLSPIISFRKWLDEAHPGCPVEDGSRRCEEYLTKCYRSQVMPLDPVATFHYSNGAILDRVLPAADPRYRQFLGANGHLFDLFSNNASSYGFMASYRYEPQKLSERAATFQKYRKRE